MTTLILRMATRLLVPLSLIFSAFVYFKGHQTPGGGFVAGLVAGVALVVLRMSEGETALHRVLPAAERSLVAIGLSLALLTGVGAFLFDLPFLTSAHGYLPLPGRPWDLEWASVMTFDLGVYLVVAGVVVGMIDALSTEVKEGTEGLRD